MARTEVVCHPELRNHDIEPGEDRGESSDSASSRLLGLWGRSSEELSAPGEDKQWERHITNLRPKYLVCLTIGTGG